MKKLEFLERCSRGWALPMLAIVLLATSPISLAGELHDAASAGDLDRVQKLVVQGADVNARAERKETPLMHAALAGQGEVVNYLLQRGADIGARSASGLTALHAAAYAGQTEIVSLLLAKGASVNDTANRFETTALHLASEENHVDTVSALLQHGADFGLVETNGYSAMTQAGWRGYWDVVETLLAAGAKCQGLEIAGDWLYGECTAREKTN